jgi:hypothetical protein
MSYTHGSWFHGHIDLSMRTLPTRGRAVAIYEEALAMATEDKAGDSFLDLSFLTSHPDSEEHRTRRN